MTAEAEAESARLTAIAEEAAVVMAEGEDAHIRETIAALVAGIVGEEDPDLETAVGEDRVDLETVEGTEEAGLEAQIAIDLATGER